MLILIDAERFFDDIIDTIRNFIHNFEILSKQSENELFDMASNNFFSRRANEYYSPK